MRARARARARVTPTHPRTLTPPHASPPSPPSPHKRIGRNRRRFPSQILRVCWREMGRDRRGSLYASDRARERRRDQTLHLHGTASDPAESAGPPSRVSRAAFPCHPAAFPSQPGRLSESSGRLSEPAGCLSESAGPPIRVSRLSFRVSRLPLRVSRTAYQPDHLSESVGPPIRVSRAAYPSQPDRLSELA